MRRFNPEKELKKIQKGNKNKIKIISVIALLLVVAIGSSYALYQVRYSKRIIYTKVGDFSRDLNLAVYIDDNKQKKFPDKDEKVVYIRTDCNDKNFKASWDYNTWTLDIESKLPNKCNVYFETRWKDTSGAAYPELYQGLIPVTIDEDTGTIKVADLKSEWYDYGKHNWANAVLVTTSKYNELVDVSTGKLKSDAKGKILKLSNNDGTNADGDILQMYVWIPRYRYQLFNTLNRGVEPQSINISFEGTYSRKSNGQNNGEWLTHPAFTFGETELPGIWVGKFEPSEKATQINNAVNATPDSAIQNITILPNKVSITNRNISTMFTATQSITSDTKYNLNSSEIDTHMMKNIEWGAVVYLSQSKYGIYNNTSNCTIEGCKVYINNVASGENSNSGGAITGCSGVSADAEPLYKSTSCNGRTWEKEGMKASTTGNVYGIYDMAGGMWEYVMGNMVDINGAFSKNNSNFTQIPNKKYYDTYSYDEVDISHYRGHLGDATKETLKNYGDNKGGWHDDWARFPEETELNERYFHWFVRGGHAENKTLTGLYAFSRNTGEAISFITFRVVLTMQDP